MISLIIVGCGAVVKRQASKSREASRKLLIKLSLPRGLQAFGLTLISNTPLLI
jgi:uncharacterized protein YceK